MPVMKVILIGYMGSGKSAVGKILAAKLDFPFVDLDDAIEKSAGQSISELFKTKGEIFFRKQENKVLKDVLSSSGHLILATGGGTPCYGDAINVMKNTPGSKVIYLRTPISVLTNRLYPEKSGRPLIAHLDTPEDIAEFIGIHIFERLQFYNRADITIDTGTKTVEEIVKEVLEGLSS